MNKELEAIVKATQCSDLLMSDIRAAHSLACHKNPLLEILLRDLIADAVRLNCGRRNETGLEPPV